MCFKLANYNANNGVCGLVALNVVNALDFWTADQGLDSPTSLCAHMLTKEQ